MRQPSQMIRCAASLLVLAGLCQAPAQIVTFNHDPSGSLVVITQSVAGLPVNVTPPTTQVVSKPGSASFHALTDGPGPISYQWLSNGIPMDGAITDTLTISNLDLVQNLITNGGFELPQEGYTYLAYAAGANIGGWLVETGNVDHVFTFWEAAEGRESLDLNGTVPGAVYRDVATTPGQQYLFHFALAGNYVTAPAFKTNETWWDGQLLATNIFYATGHSATQMGWSNVEYLVTASSSSTRIRFASRSPGAGGSVIDNVTLFPVPPPPAEYSVIVSNPSGNVTSSVATIQFDSDGNGLPDSWERQYLGSIGTLSDDDVDGDGVSNLDEFREGTNPASAASVHPRLNITVNGHGVVVVPPINTIYAYGQNVHVTAVPDPGSMFIGWFGMLTNISADLDLMLTNSKTLTAIFGLTLTNGANHFGEVGPINPTTYALTVNAGDSINLRCGEISGSALFAPNVDIFNPNGALVATAGNATEAYLAHRAVTSGVFRVDISSYYAGNSGSYRLTLAQAPRPFVVPPGDEGGLLTNGMTYSAVTELGDQDLWSFAANAGDSIILRAGRLSGSANYTPWIRLYNTNGVLLDSVANVNDALVSLRMPNTGTFMATVDTYYVGETGAYQLTFGKSSAEFVVPSGDEGGPLTNGGQHDGVTTMGDEDVWSLAANTGDTIVLRCAKTFGSASFAPWVRLYGSNGALLAADADASDTFVSYRATNSAIFTVFVGAYYPGYTGNYRLRLAKAPGSFVVPAGDDGGLLASRTNYDAITDLGDEDLWTFNGYKGSPFTVACTKLSGGASYFPWARLYNSSGALLTFANSGTTGLLNYTPTNHDTFTLLVGSYYPGYTGAYRLIGTNISDGLRLVSPLPVGTNLSLSATGGGSNVQAVLYSSTNVARPLAQWTPIRTNRFDTFGTLVVTNFFNPSYSEQYFRLRIP